MTTSRVTVPVEDLLFYKLKDLILEQSEGEWTDEMIVRDAHHFANYIRPLLSAAPAPEGGAVRAWMFRESPSERWHVTMDRRSVDEYLKAFSTAEVHPLAIATREEAREDAQPVAWRYRFVTSTDGKDWSDWFLVDGRTYIPTRENQTIEPLYTHPAPDALRVAVEQTPGKAWIDCVQKMLDRFDRAKGKGGYPTANEREAMRRCMIPVHLLAVLQAEQKGGA